MSDLFPVQKNFKNLISGFQACRERTRIEVLGGLLEGIFGKELCFGPGNSNFELFGKKITNSWVTVKNGTFEFTVIPRGLYLAVIWA